MGSTRAAAAGETMRVPYSAGASRDAMLASGPSSDSAVAAGASTGRIQMRQIRIDDLPAVADLLHRGFPDRRRDYFLTALRRLKEYEQPAGTPQFGYLIAAGAKL